MIEGADALLPDMAAEVLLADKAFDADEQVIEPLLARGKSIVMPRNLGGCCTNPSRNPNSR
jgi:hypothetical protein